MRKRRAAVLLELIVAWGLLAVLLAITLDLFATMSATKRTNSRRAIALQQAANVAETVAAIPFAELSPERLAQIELPKSTESLLPGAKLRLTVDPLADRLPARQVHVEISWMSARGGAAAPVRLDYWAHDVPPSAASGTGQEESP